VAYRFLDVLAARASRYARHHQLDTARVLWRPQIREWETPACSPLWQSWLPARRVSWHTSRWRRKSRSGGRPRALRKREQELRLLVEGVADHAMIMLDANGVVASWNNGAEGITGYAAADIAGFRHPFWQVESIGIASRSHSKTSSG
jgi:PAS domain-containing protein